MRKTGTVAGFKDGYGPQAKECSQPLEARKVTESYPLRLDFSPVRLIWDF